MDDHDMSYCLQCWQLEELMKPSLQSTFLLPTMQGLASHFQYTITEHQSHMVKFVLQLGIEDEASQLVSLLPIHEYLFT
jgi:hypothetical protein